MTDIPILPNPFKMLDLEREKKMKLMDDKCNSCDDDKKEGFKPANISAGQIPPMISNETPFGRSVLNLKRFNNLKKDKPIIEGMEQTAEGLTFAGVLICGALIMVLIIWVTFRNKSKENIIGFYSEYYVKFIMLVFFIGFAFISLFLHTNDLGNTTNNAERINNELGLPYTVPLFVGGIMYLLRVVPWTGDVPALIGYFENTVGHFWFLVYSLWNEGLNKWIRSDNFEALTTHNSDNATSDFNPLMSIINLNNYEEIIKQMRFDGDTNQNNENGDTSDFFVTLNHIDGQKTKEEFIEYIKKQVIMKRACGEVTLLILTTLISTGILQSVYH
jgi:uncharacterized membrane protein YhaH (DUF805 family)